MATTKKQNTAQAKAAAAKEAEAQAKADEVAALMGEDSETATEKVAPPTIIPSTDDETEGQEGGETEDEEGDETEGQEGGETEDEEGDETEGQEGGETEDEEGGETEEKVSRLVILSRTIHTKDKDGKEVKFVASKEPQDLGEYGERAIKAGFAKEYKAG